MNGSAATQLMLRSCHSNNMMNIGHLNFIHTTNMYILYIYKKKIISAMKFVQIQMY